MPYINRIMLLGNVGQDPEFSSYPGGDMMARFSLATTKKYTNRSGEKKELTTWHRITVTGKAVDVVRGYVRKGSLVFIEGEQLNGSYTNTSGQTIPTSEVKVVNLQILNTQTT